MVCFIPYHDNSLYESCHIKNLYFILHSYCNHVHKSYNLKHLGGIDKKPGYVFVAIERTTRYVYVEVVHKKDAGTIASCLKRFLTFFPGKIHTILTDNGSEFTDRFAGLRTGVPSGAHTFDQVCKQHQIKHKLTKPFSPQTNGMVERFNRRITEAINLRPAI